jgi:predicted transcriptional regulator
VRVTNRSAAGDTPAALLSIRPHFAEAIFAGAKVVEFRRRRLPEDISRLILYETYPHQRVTGECRVLGQEVSAPDAIWEWARFHGALSEAEFVKYFSGSAYAVAIVVGHVRRWDSPRTLAQIGVTSPPQSWKRLACPPVV